MYKILSFALNPHIFEWQNYGPESIWSKLTNLPYLTHNCLTLGVNPNLAALYIFCGEAPPFHILCIFWEASEDNGGTSGAVVRANWLKREERLSKWHHKTSSSSSVLPSLNLNPRWGAAALLIPSLIDWKWWLWSVMSRMRPSLHPGLCDYKS